MLLRPFLYDHGSCASYLFGCTTHQKLAVVDAHADLVDDYLAAAASVGSPIVAVFETHVQADHVSGLPGLIARTGLPKPFSGCARQFVRQLRALGGQIDSRSAVAAACRRALTSTSSRAAWSMRSRWVSACSCWLSAR
jgi:glyoxylase-like metal-dependent hydrolase (beta-lactamase superfamily II)